MIDRQQKRYINNIDDILSMIEGGRMTFSVPAILAIKVVKEGAEDIAQ